jgi:hypothetical protein
MPDSFNWYAKGTAMIRPTGIASMVALALLTTGSGAPMQSCKPAPQPSHTGATIGAVAALAGVAIGTAVLVEMHHHKHTVKGCVSVGPNGLQIQNDGDKKTYTLVGVTTNTKAGDRVKLHGLKEKKEKDGMGGSTFVVESINKNYGSCHVMPATP